MFSPRGHAVKTWKRMRIMVCSRTVELQGGVCTPPSHQWFAVPRFGLSRYREERNTVSYCWRPGGGMGKADTSKTGKLHAFAVHPLTLRGLLQLGRVQSIRLNLTSRRASARGRSMVERWMYMRVEVQNNENQLSPPDHHDDFYSTGGGHLSQFVCVFRSVARSLCSSISVCSASC